MTCLLIGGSADGSRIPFPEDLRIYRQPHRNGYDTYHARKFVANGSETRVFVEEHLTLEDALRMMVGSYQSAEPYKNALTLLVESLRWRVVQRHSDGEELEGNELEAFEQAEKLLNPSSEKTDGH